MQLCSDKNIIINYFKFGVSIVFFKTHKSIKSDIIYKIEFFCYKC